MGLDSKELRLLDLNSSGFVVPKSISDFLTEISMIHDIPTKLSKLNDYVYVLEQEMKKIDGFKRELPLCMLLLNDAILKLKEEVVQLKRKELEAMDHEEGGGKKSADWTEKKNWMSSAQLWTTPIQYENGVNAVKIQDSFFLHQSMHQERDDEIARRSPSDQTWSFNKELGGAFVPFKKPYGGGIVKTEEEEEEDQLDGLSLFMPEAGGVGLVDRNSRGKNVARECGGVLSERGSSSQPQSKKQRRCWSHDLHQCFVKALFQLGGPLAATPKQIKEIMQVDGLTNDEVKSHLQKYRLYIRKLLTSSSGASPNYECLRREECNDLLANSVAQSGSPEGPLHLAKGASVTGGDSTVEEEDVKSESHSWKGRHLKPTE